MNRSPVRVRLSAQKNWKNISIRYVLFLFIDASNLGRKIKMLYQTGVKKNKRVAYPCLTWIGNSFYVRIFKKVYNFIIISRLLIYLLTVDLICKPKGCNCLWVDLISSSQNTFTPSPLPIINILIQGGNYMVKIFRKKGHISWHQFKFQRLKLRRIGRLQIGKRRDDKPVSFIKTDSTNTDMLRWRLNFQHYRTRQSGA